MAVSRLDLRADAAIHLFHVPHGRGPAAPACPRPGRTLTPALSLCKANPRRQTYTSRPGRAQSSPSPSTASPRCAPRATQAASTTSPAGTPFSGARARMLRRRAAWARGWGASSGRRARWLDALCALPRRPTFGLRGVVMLDIRMVFCRLEHRSIPPTSVI